MNGNANPNVDTLSIFIVPPSGSGKLPLCCEGMSPNMNEFTKTQFVTDSHRQYDDSKVYIIVLAKVQ